MRGITMIVGGLVMAACAGGASAQDSCPGDRPIKLTASDGQTGDIFGSSVAIDGDTAIVGAYWDDDRGTDSGSAYVFEKINGTWTQTAKLTASDGQADDSFGGSVAISGDTAIVGADGDDDLGTDAGSAFVFEKINGTWTQTAKLTASDGQAGDRFGFSVAIDGDTAIVGAVGDDDRGVTAGAVYVFQRLAGSWFFIDKLLASDGQALDTFGVFVEIDGDTAIVGADGDDDLGGGSGSAYVFQRVGNAWNETAKLTASDGQAGDNFGRSVAIDGDTVIIGAYRDDDHGGGSGSAYVFQRVGNGWNETAKLTASDGQAGDNFGRSVAIDGDTAVVGAAGDDDRGGDSGSAYVFEKVGGTWTQTAKLLAPDGQAGDEFGFSVAISAGTSIIGASKDDVSEFDSGSAYIFPWTRPNDCCADIDRSGVLDGADLFVFLDLFAADDLRADFNGDGAIDAGDFFIYLDEFEEGCP